MDSEDSLKSFGGEHPELKVLDWLGIPASDDGSRPPESVEVLIRDS